MISASTVQQKDGNQLWGGKQTDEGQNAVFKGNQATLVRNQDEVSKSEAIWLALNSQVFKGFM